MSILRNAIDSIVLGLEDYGSADPRRLLSCTRNLYAGILLLFKHRLSELSPAESDEALIKEKVEPVADGDTIHWRGKGKKTVDLTWSGAAGATVDIYREGSFLLNTANDENHTDSTNLNGGGTLTYEVCEQGIATSCSDPETAIF